MTKPSQALPPAWLEGLTKLPRPGFWPGGCPGRPGVLDRAGRLVGKTPFRAPAGGLAAYQVRLTSKPSCGFYTCPKLLNGSVVLTNLIGKIMQTFNLFFSKSQYYQTGEFPIQFQVPILTANECPICLNHPLKPPGLTINK